MDYLFSSLFRLKTRPQIQSVLSASRKTSGGSIAAFVRPNTLDSPRLAIIVAKRYVKHAVKRNRIKRIIKESFRHHKHELGGVDIVIRVYKDVNDLDNKNLHQCINNLLKKLAS